MCVGPLPLQHAAALCVNAVPARVAAGTPSRAHVDGVAKRTVTTGCAQSACCSTWSPLEVVARASRRGCKSLTRGSFPSATFCAPSQSLLLAERLFLLAAAHRPPRPPTCWPLLSRQQRNSAAARSKPSTRTSHSQRGQRSARLQGVTATAGGASGGGARCARAHPVPLQPLCTPVINLYSQYGRGCGGSLRWRAVHPLRGRNQAARGAAER